MAHQATSRRRTPWTLSQICRGIGGGTSDGRAGSKRNWRSPRESETVADGTGTARGVSECVVAGARLVGGADAEGLGPIRFT